MLLQDHDADAAICGGMYAASAAAGDLPVSTWRTLFCRVDGCLAAHPEGAGALKIRFQLPSKGCRFELDAHYTTDTEALERLFLQD